MQSTVKLRLLTADEEVKVRQIANSRKGSHNLVQRAKIIVALLENPNLSASKAGMLVGFKTKQSGITWVKRFNENGINGLEDKLKTDYPLTHDPDVRNKLLEFVKENQDKPCDSYNQWTLKYTQKAFKENYGLYLSISTIWEWTTAEGIKWPHPSGYWRMGYKK